MTSIQEKKKKIKNNEKRKISISHVLWASVSVASHVLYTHDLSAHKPELTGGPCGPPVNDRLNQ